MHKKDINKKNKKKQGNSVAQDLPPTGSEHQKHFFYTSPASKWRGIFQYFPKKNFFFLKIVGNSIER